MATYRTISCKTVIAKVYRDLRLNDANRELDMIEWIGEALEFIGSGVTFKNKPAVLAIENHRAILPNDLVSIIQVKYKGSSSYHKPLKYNPKSFPEALHEVDRAHWKSLAKESYTYNDNYLQTDFEQGEVLLSYVGIATDKDGYPMIPDNQYFKEALFWYIFKQLLLGGYRHHMTIDYEFAYEKWRYFAMNAKNEAVYPDIGGYQRFLELWVGLVPHQRLFDKGFSLDEGDQFERELIDATNMVTRPIKVEKPDESVTYIDVDGGDAFTEFEVDGGGA